MVDGDDGQLLNYPLSRQVALEPPTKWQQLRQQCPVAQVTLPSGDKDSPLIPSLELAVSVEDLRPLEGSAVGGLRELPVRW